MTDPLVDKLRTVLGGSGVIVDREVMAGYERDWTGRFEGRARAVVRPVDAGGVAAALRTCTREGVPVVFQGGNTGLVGGGVPRGGEVLLSLRGLDRIESVDSFGATATVGAGVTLADLQARCALDGLMPGIDLASRDSATLGGMVATNAGGVLVTRFGHIRGQILGLEAVTADGDLIGRVPGLAKDNTGYDLVSLLAGSEGTLAAVTRIQVRLVTVPAHSAVALLGFETFGAALDASGRLRRSLTTLSALEGFFEDGLELVCRHTGMGRPFATSCGAYLLVEASGPADVLPELSGLCAGLPGLMDSAVAADAGSRRELWAYRERHTEAIGHEGTPHKLDVCLPAGSVEPFRERVKSTLAGLGTVRTVMFGHVGEGNLHVNLLGPEPDDLVPDRAVFELVAELGGSISAEHGIGVAKAQFLELVRTPAERAWMQGVKGVFDRKRLLNPGVIFSREGDSDV